MTTKTASPPGKRPSGLSPADIVWLDGHAAHWAKIARWSKAKQRAYLIQLGTLNADGTLRRYPMDHVPLGPRE